jgi:hypothetical protein
MLRCRRASFLLWEIESLRAQEFLRMPLPNTFRLFVGILTLFAVIAAQGDELKFRAEQLKSQLTVGYAVQLVDINGDSKDDIVIVDSKRFLWLENPAWEEHLMHEDQAARADNVCFSAHDIDGDGKLDFAVGRDWQFGNTKSGGTIGWLQQGAKPADPWRYHPIGEEPTTHRMRFADLDADGVPELIVAPLKGRGTTDPNFAENGVRLLSFKIPSDPVNDEWPATVINDKLHVMHNFQPVDVSGNKQLDILCASFEGVTLLERKEDGSWMSSHIGEGQQDTPAPARGASEIKLGHLANDLKYIATIEPWHGDKVVVYTQPRIKVSSAYRTMWPRQVLDAELKWGHAVWCANLDGDADEELIIGVRDHKDETHRAGLRIYDPVDGAWKRQLIDPGGVNIEDLAAGDLNGDGKIDIVAVGRQSRNVKIYWNETK